MAVDAYLHQLKDKQISGSRQALERWALLTSRAGKVIGVGVLIYVYGRKKLNRTLAINLRLSNIRGGTSHQIYGLAILLISPETLSSLSKLRGFLYLMCTML